MGVPKFYRWLSERFPLINQAISDATLLPEVDNLYLDLNGTIHNATHGDGASRKLEMKDVMMSIMTSIDHSVKLVRCWCGGVAQFSPRATEAPLRAAPSCAIDLLAAFARAAFGPLRTPSLRCIALLEPPARTAQAQRRSHGRAAARRSRTGSPRCLCRGFTAFALALQRAVALHRLLESPAPCPGMSGWCAVQGKLHQICPFQPVVDSDGCSCSFLR